MPSSKEYLEYVLEQLSDLEEITYRKMMGEYILYCKGKIFGGIYDDRLLVKPVPSALRMMPESRRELPYEGVREMLLVSDVDNHELLCRLVEAMLDELPEGKRKKPKKQDS